MTHTILLFLFFDVAGQCSSLLVLVSIIAFVDVDFITVLVDTTVPSQVDEESTRDIFDRPEVECS